MHIHQLNVSHNERHDRLLVRLNTQDGQEFRFWLTRRMTLRLLPVLGQTLGQLESSPVQMLAPDPASRSILTELKRDEFLHQADFKTPYVEQDRELPLGEEPMLVSDVQLQLQGTGVLITLQDKGAKATGTSSCQLHLQAALVHGLMHLIEQAMNTAEWQMPLSRDTDTAAAPVAPATAYRH